MLKPGHDPASPRLGTSWGRRIKLNDAMRDDGDAAQDRGCEGRG